MTLLVLTLAYVGVLVLLLNLGFRSNWRWQVKLAAVFLSFIFYVGTWFGLKELQGWPVKAQLPATFRLVSQHIVQPNKLHGSEGVIYVWVVDLEDAENDEPRAYRLPYIEQLHEDIIEATADDKPRIGRRVERVAGDNKADDSKNKLIEFYEVPRARLPEKE